MLIGEVAQPKESFSHGTARRRRVPAPTVQQSHWKRRSDYPQFVRGIVLVGASVDPAQEKAMRIQHVANWLLVSAFVPRPLDDCNRELLALKADLIVLPLKPSRLDILVVMVHGSKDRLVPLANVNFLERELNRPGKGNLFP